MGKKRLFLICIIVLTILSLTGCSGRSEPTNNTVDEIVDSYYKRFEPSNRGDLKILAQKPIDEKMLVLAGLSSLISDKTIFIEEPLTDEGLWMGFMIGGLYMKWEFESFTINTDKSLVSADRVKEFLADSYWASDRSKELIEKTIMNSFCYGVYHEEKLVGFARVVSDYSTMAWICDVYIDKNYRGKGLGKKLIVCILETPEFKNLRGFLVTRDAHGLYEQYGFERVESRLMTRTSLG